MYLEPSLSSLVSIQWRFRVGSRCIHLYISEDNCRSLSFQAGQPAVLRAITYSLPVMRNAFLLNLAGSIITTLVPWRRVTVKVWSFLSSLSEGLGSLELIVHNFIALVCRILSNCLRQLVVPVAFYLTYRDNAINSTLPSVWSRKLSLLYYITCELNWVSLLDHLGWWWVATATQVAQFHCQWCCISGLLVVCGITGRSVPGLLEVCWIVLDMEGLVLLEVRLVHLCNIDKFTVLLFLISLSSGWLSSLRHWPCLPRISYIGANSLGQILS